MVPLPAIQFLVHATGRPATLADAVAHNPDGRIGWVLELLERQAAARLQR